MTGHIVWLNGTTSAGKTSIAHQIQEQAQETYLLTGLDEMASRVPIKLDRERKDDEPPSDHQWFEFVVSAADGELVELRVGSAFRELLASMYRGAAELADAGFNVIIDDVLLDADQFASAKAALAGHPVCFVGVRCPVDVATRRERARGDRRLGLARTQMDAVHLHGDYDIEVDTSKLSPREAAEHILKEIRWT